MTKSQIAATALVAGLATAIFLQSRGNARLQRENDALRQQTARLDELRAENERLTQSRPTGEAALNQNQLRELMRLRGQVGVLKDQLAQAKKTEAKVTVPNPPPAADLEAPQTKLAMAKMNYARQWLMAFLMYANEHQEACPTDFDQAAAYWSKGEKTDSDFTTNQFQLVYQGAFNEITNPAQTIVLREIEPMQGTAGGWLKTYGFADGHTEVHNEPDGNFEGWESQHVQRAPGQ